MKKLIIIASFISSLSLVFLACNKAEDKKDNTSNGFDKSAMLTYYADNMIIQGYTNLQTKLASLQDALQAFTDNPSLATQATLKTAYTATHLQFVTIEAFRFGPAENILLDQFFNFTGGLDYSFTTDGALTGFSVDTATIEKNISEGVYNFSTQNRSSFYSQGFPALNYLCFSSNALNKFDTHTAARKKYILEIGNRMKSLSDKVLSDWTTYKNEFVSNTQTNVGSPIGNLVNQLAYQLDVLKGPRLGWPLGKQSNGIVFATKVEAYYAGISVALAVENLNSLKNIYSANASGKGLSDYLIALNHATLNTDVLAQFDAAIAKLKIIPDPLSTSLTTNASDVDAAYKEVQKLLTLLKTDVASATAVQINFMDNDGD